MNLDDFNEKKQRVILANLGERFIDMANNSDPEDVEATLQIIQEHYLDALGPDDFFGTEGWESWLSL